METQQIPATWRKRAEIGTRPGFNAYEVKNRAAKVRRVVGVVVKLGEPLRSDLVEAITSDTLDASGWFSLETMAGTLPLSAKSRRVVAEILRHSA